MKANLKSSRPRQCSNCSVLSRKFNKLREEFSSRDELFNELRRLRAWKHEYDMKRLSPPKRTLRMKFGTWMRTGYFK